MCDADDASQREGTGVSECVFNRYGGKCFSEREVVWSSGGIRGRTASMLRWDN